MTKNLFDSTIMVRPVGGGPPRRVTTHEYLRRANTYSPPLGLTDAETMVLIQAIFTPLVTMAFTDNCEAHTSSKRFELYTESSWEEKYSYIENYLKTHLHDFDSNVFGLASKIEWKTDPKSDARCTSDPLYEGILGSSVPPETFCDIRDYLVRQGMHFSVHGRVSIRDPYRTDDFKHISASHAPHSTPGSSTRVLVLGDTLEEMIISNTTADFFNKNDRPRWELRHTAKMIPTVDGPRSYLTAQYGRITYSGDYGYRIGRGDWYTPSATLDPYAWITVSDKGAVGTRNAIQGSPFTLAQCLELMSEEVPLILRPPVYRRPIQRVRVVAPAHGSNSALIMGSYVHEFPYVLPGEHAGKDERHEALAALLSDLSKINSAVRVLPVIGPRTATTLGPESEAIIHLFLSEVWNVNSDPFDVRHEARVSAVVAVRRAVSTALSSSPPSLIRNPKWVAKYRQLTRLLTQMTETE